MDLPLALFVALLVINLTRWLIKRSQVSFQGARKRG